MQVETLCWCGARATHNARTVGGVMVLEGEQVVVGDVTLDDEVVYTVLCRRHHRARQAYADTADLPTTVTAGSGSGYPD